MAFEWRAYPDVITAAAACAGRMALLLNEAADARGFATLAVSGGGTSGYLFDQMASTPVAWNKIHLFWVDERAVPPEDDASNFRLAKERLIDPAGIPAECVHRIPGELSPEAAAREYCAEIRKFFALGPGATPHFDLIHRGMGADAHTASLFPGEPAIHDRSEIAAAVYVRKMSQWRITLLPGVLVAATHTVVLAAGEDKAEAVRMVFREPYSPSTYPAQINHDGSAEWFLDSAAARLL